MIESYISEITVRWIDHNMIRILQFVSHILQVT